MNTFENEQGWQLDSLRIDLVKWGEFAGKHTAKITFQNKNTDAFTFVLSPEETMAYIHLLKDKIASNAGFLGQRLIQSLGLLPAPEETKAIGEAITHEAV
jgi:hypothetical protein